MKNTHTMFTGSQSITVSHLAAQESEMDRKMTATSGTRCFVSSTRLDPLGLLVKTLLESPRWYSPARRLKWEVTRTFAERVTRCTRNDNDTSSIKSDLISNQSDILSSQLLYRLVPSERPTGEIGCGFWQEKMILPTPTASCKNGGTNKNGKDGTPRTSELNHLLANRLGRNSLQLNPLFVDEMMGFPEGYLVSPFQNGDKKA